MGFKLFRAGRIHIAAEEEVLNTALPGCAPRARRTRPSDLSAPAWKVAAA